MKIWNVKIEAIMSKNDPDLWENWANVNVVADSLEQAVQKAIAFEKAEYDFVNVRASEAKFVLEVDVE